ncbi:hypothetical protein [Tenacibaculum sp. M341]|uniref:hypothetical protein n=1 Tax=Tenacibaculum sp. M341 TaxID=2530339 RepID=UPI001052F370|nr:hypothetical protein [Tenacibaculum sp. M341]TCI94218.1 hypothetical protein EYW44_02415 [Tenacibaculum sp. M341]
MKKSILNLGKLLNKTEQKNINGGGNAFCNDNGDCDSGYFCDNYICVSDGSNDGGGNNGGGSGCTFMKFLCEYPGDTCCLF